jgi:hypothetical protein
MNYPKNKEYYFYLNNLLEPVKLIKFFFVPIYHHYYRIQISYENVEVIENRKIDFQDKY